MGALTTKLNVKNGNTVQTITSYSTQDEGTVQTAFSGTTNLGTYWKITNNGVDAYIGLWPTSVASGGNPNHSALQVIKGGTTYYVETIVKNTFTLTLAATTNQTITLKYTQPGASQVTKTSTSSAQNFTVKVGTTWTATIAGSTYYSAGSLNASSGTVRANTTVSASAATHITYTITLTQKSNETVTIHYKNHSGTALASSWSTTTASVTLGKGSQYYSTIAASTGYTAGTITSPGTSSSPNTLNAAVTISFTAATINKYTVYAKTAGLTIGGTARSSGWSASYNYNASISVQTTASWSDYNIKVYKGTSSSGTLWLTKTTRSFSYNVPTSHTAIYNNSDCSDCGCCVAEGTLVTCWDNGKYTYKKIEDIQSGDTVVGANGQLNEVYARTDTILGKERTMFTFIDNSLYFTGEHSMWVRYKDKEYFGIHDISGYYREKTAIVNGQPLLEWEQEKTYRENRIVGKPISKGLSRDPIFVLFDADYGTDKGWKHNQAIIAKDKVYENDTPIHTLILGGNHTFFANGYLVSGFATDVDYDYKNVKIEDLKLFEEKYYEKKNV